MGIINTTPDSFSDGGQFYILEKACLQARKMIEAGADIIDIGGESTRPGAQPVSKNDELERTIPLIRAVRGMSDITISIDTNKPEVMEAAITAGADMVNSTDALGQKNALSVVADLNVPVCFMHMQGSPETMQKAPYYHNVVTEVIIFLNTCIEKALDAGIARHHIIVDPGFGFGKSLLHNLELLKSLSEFKALGVPLLVGLSRKSMIGTITNKPVGQRLYGSIATAVVAAMQGADIIRVHDVAETIDAIKIVRAVLA